RLTLQTTPATRGCLSLVARIVLAGCKSRPRIPQLNEAGWEALRLKQLQRQLGKAVAEQRPPGAEHERDDVDGELVDEPLAQEAADELATIEVHAPRPLPIQPVSKRAHGTGPQLFAVRRACGTSGEDNDPLVAVRPGGKAEHRLVGAAANHQGVDAREKRAIAVVLAVKGIEPVNAAVLPSDEAIDAGRNEDRKACVHRPLQCPVRRKTPGQ